MTTPVVLTTTTTTITFKDVSRASVDSNPELMQALKTLWETARDKLLLDARKCKNITMPEMFGDIAPSPVGYVAATQAVATAASNFATNENLSWAQAIYYFCLFLGCRFNQPASMEAIISKLQPGVLTLLYNLETDYPQLWCFGSLPELRDLMQRVMRKDAKISDLRQPPPPAF